MKTIDLEISSKRNTMIPCTITLPDHQENMKLFMMAHGFCATRHENGTFTMLAEELSNAGIATIRCDFPGCNDSKEDHRFNCLENDMDNLDSMLEYMIQNYFSSCLKLIFISISKPLFVRTHNKLLFFLSFLLLLQVIFYH